MNDKAREEARDRRRKKEEEFVPPSPGERVRYQADPGETMDHFRKRVRNRDPSLKVLSREDLPTEDPYAAMRKVDGGPGGKGSLFGAMDSLGGYGATAPKESQQQGTAVLARLDQVDATMKAVNRNIESLRTSTLNVRDVTVGDPRLDRSGIEDRM
jgi:hypothetical protein